MNEDEILTRVVLEKELAKLHPADAAMVKLIFRLQQPDDWTAKWPPKYHDVGIYIGLKYEGAPLSEAAIRYRRDAVLGMWRGERGFLRRNRQD